MSLFLLSFAMGCIHAMEPATIHEAASGGNLAAVQRFIDQDPTSVNQQTPNGNTPLHLIAWMPPHELSGNHVAIARFLIANNALINKKNNRDATPVYLATEIGNETMVRFLLDNSASVNMPESGTSWTPLHVAVWYGKLRIARTLLEHGASIRLQNKEGKTAFDYATSPQMIRLHQEWRQLLAQWQKTAQSAFCGALHPRLGANSPANVLSQPLLQEILQHLHPEDFATINRPASCAMVNSTRSFLANHHVQITGAATLAAAFGLWRLLH